MDSGILDVDAECPLFHTKQMKEGESKLMNKSGAQSNGLVHHSMKAYFTIHTTRRKQIGRKVGSRAGGGGSAEIRRGFRRAKVWEWIGVNGVGKYGTWGYTGPLHPGMYTYIRVYTFANIYVHIYLFISMFLHH